MIGCFLCDTCSSEIFYIFTHCFLTTALGISLHSWINGVLSHCLSPCLLPFLKHRKGIPDRTLPCGLPFSLPMPPVSSASLLFHQHPSLCVMLEPALNPIYACQQSTAPGAATPPSSVGLPSLCPVTQQGIPSKTVRGSSVLFLLFFA